MSRSAERRARNESAFRAANERIEKKVAELSLTEERTPYLCECDDDRHRDRSPDDRGVRGRAQQADRVRRVPSHDSPPDRIVEEHEGFVVIEKAGEEARLVDQQDPRR